MEFELVGAAGVPAASEDRCVRWSVVYGKSPRQLRRWLNVGRQKDDACPLDEPAHLPSWWARCMRQRCPPELIQLANQYAQKNRADNTTPSNPRAGAPAPREESVEISGYRLEDGEAVKQAEAIVKAAWERLQRAYLDGTGNVDQLQRRHENAMESLLKIERAEVARAKLRGDYVALVDIQTDFERTVEMLRMMRESMPRRVIEQLSDVPAEYHDRVRSAILEARDLEDEVFRRMPSLMGIEDVSSALAA